MRSLLIAVGLVSATALGAPTVWAPGPNGQAIFREECRTCHGTTGKPTQRAMSQYKNMPTLDAAFLARRSEDSIVAVLNHGVGKDTKSFKDKLSAGEIAAVAKSVRETFG